MTRLLAERLRQVADLSAEGDGRTLLLEAAEALDRPCSCRAEQRRLELGRQGYQLAERIGPEQIGELGPGR